MGAVKWMMIFSFLGICSQAAVQSAFEVSVFSATTKTVILRWTRYQGASSYKITITPKSPPYGPVAFASFSSNTVMGSVTSLSSGITYIFTIDALDDSNNALSTTSTESSTAPNTMDPIQTVKPKDSTTLMAEFNENVFASHYIIRIEGNDGFFREDTVSNSPAEIKSLTPYTEYSLSILAINDAGRSQPSTPVTGRTVLPPLQLSTSSTTNDSIVVSWPAIAHAVQYTLSVHKLNSYTKMEHNTSDTNFTISGLEAGVLYTIRGYAWDPEGRKGEGSLYYNQTTYPPTPSYVNVSVVMNNGVAALSVTWEVNQEVHGPVEYHARSDQHLSCNTTSGSSCRLATVGCGEVHLIQVTAWNEAGSSYPSEPVVFITFPCPPESLALQESSDGNCSLTWNTAPHADNYVAFIKASDGREESCYTTTSNCTFHCQCGYTYIMSVLAFNQAGSSPQGQSVNHTTLPCCPEGVSVSAVSTDTLEILWTASRGAELYQTRAADNSEVILCNDTAPVCALSDLSCDSTYSVVVTPCNEISGCNHACKAHTKDTAPCMPMNLMLNPKNSSCVSVSWAGNNKAANYTVSADGGDSTHTCTSGGTSCDLADLPCGSTYEVSVMATNAAGRSLPSYSDSIETEPCCPANLTVHQVTQAMTNVSWSHAKGAHSFITSLTSPRGDARCHTQDSHCLMGCITCGTSYIVTMETYSHSGRMSGCTYQGFSSSACCPSGVKLYKMADNSVQVYWRRTGSGHTTIAEMVGTNNNYTCTASSGEIQCNLANVQCGSVYHVVVAPLMADDSKVQYCPQRMYSVTCSGSTISTVIYRGKRSVD